METLFEDSNFEFLYQFSYAFNNTMNKRILFASLLYSTATIDTFEFDSINYYSTLIYIEFFK